MRLIRPLLVARVCTLLLGLCVCAPSVAQSAQKSTRKPVTSANRAVPTAKRQPVYSASASKARKARLARARAAARAREMSRMRQLQEVMTPRYKTDLNGDLVPDVRAAAAIVFNPADRAGALGRARAGQALDRQHHEGDDRGRVHGRQPRPLGVRHRRAQRRLRRVDHVSQSERADHARERPAPHAHRLRQRRRAHSRACLPRRDARPSSSG